MNPMDTEQIMDSIRERIPDTENGWDIVRFEDIPVSDCDGASVNTGKFDRVSLEKSVSEAGSLSTIPYYRPIPGSRIKALFKKIIRKLIRFCVEPVAQDATNFNLATASSLRAMRRFTLEQSAADQQRDAEMEELRRRVEVLEAALAAARQEKAEK